MKNKSIYDIAIVGATGAVGQKIMDVLEKRNFPIGSIKLLSSKNSAGKKINFFNEEIIVEEATPESFTNVDIAFFSAGGSVSEALVPAAIEKGAVVIDNTSAYRMDANVPLVVPEVNETDIKNHKGLIANPNCSTIQMVTALKPIQKAYGLNRIIVSTYQAVSGSGKKAVDELDKQTRNYVNKEETKPEVLPVAGDKRHYPIAFNALPQIDVFQENGYTAEEMKMINETKKIMHLPDVKVAATCVRLPFFTSHAESIYIEIDKENINPTDIWKVLESQEGVVLEDDIQTQTYPTPLSAMDKDEVFVGRVRKDLDCDKGFHMWVVSDNLLKGAALNTVQIAESLIKNKWL
ncbi:aspartate-semialdehyde dehydrogenase [Cerasibacillus terrae]|uniref:Aspartate-semialdehyde dehydrogenase n=1 Tax=Cerasibacillus terrae TaxID=2498845 RepID=A0A5C8P3L7_9BACI|nr:aspartate-semialdehyde dehydrogenase [Cerasibacillus terrae]TXL67733.1 aspartate-semialdehyde dehydrogenase [Cerasibacillus terrae]